MSHSSPQRRLHVLLVAALAAAVVGVACTEERAPKLLPLDQQTVAVNDELRIAVLVENPDGLGIEYGVDGPELPNFDDVTYLSQTPTGAEFRWTPLSSHVGTHELIFTIKSSAGTDSTSVIVNVIPAASAAPIFLRPGFGGTFDLGRDPCVTFDVEVRDDDSLNVEIRPRKPLPTGALLQGVDGNAKRARFEWCPTEEQVQRSLRWNVALEADDGDHVPPTPHDYLIVLRTPAKGNCPGAAPTVTVTAPAVGATLNNAGGYPVEITVSDDNGVRDAPILYYTTHEPEPDAGLGAFDQQREFKQGTARDQWRAVIPPLELLEGQQQGIWYMVSVTDNDDATGTGCDHTAESEVRNLVARGGGGLAQDCEACTASTQCASGICAAEAGGTCLPACAGGSCVKGSCVSIATASGQTAEGCGDVAAVCQGGGGACTNDGAEPNDDVADATPVNGSQVSGTICPGDIDGFKVTALDEGEAVFTLSGFDNQANDLDLALLSADGDLIAVSGGIDPTEQITYCMALNETVIAAVFGYSDKDQSPFTLSIAQSSGSCCTDDAGEADDSLAQARPVGTDGSFEGTICPLDPDYVSFQVSTPQKLTATVVFTAAGVDLDLVLYGPSDNFVAGAWNDTPEQEELVVDLSTAGTYKLKVEPFGGGTAEYIGMIALQSIGGCATTLDCPSFTVCRSAQCGTDSCATTADCPTGHACAMAGPGADYGYCGLTCTTNTQCRTDEGCKWFTTGRSCGLKGSGANGDACTFYEQCGGQRDCLAWPGGYCARAACTSNADCESNTFCAAVNGINACVRRCGGTEPPCRLAEGYLCSTLPVLGGGSDQGCTP